jgi:hypothetical protein
VSVVGTAGWVGERAYIGEAEGYGGGRLWDCGCAGEEVVLRVMVGEVVLWLLVLLGVVVAWEDEGVVEVDGSSLSLNSRRYSEERSLSVKQCFR